MENQSHTGADPEETNEPLEGLVREALESLQRNGVDPSEVSLFLRQTSETCAQLQDQIEAHTVAKVGLEAILSAYDARYGDRADQNKDVALFRKILAEKEGLLAELEAGYREQARRVGLFLTAMDKRRLSLDQDLDRFQAALEKIRGSHQAIQQGMAADRAKVEAVQERYWPSNGKSPAEPERINLPKETLHRIVDNALEQVSPDRKVRSELIGQVLSSIKDEDLKTVLSQKMAPNLDDLPEVSDDEFWED
jgi:hypothetical protein